MLIKNQSVKKIHMTVCQLATPKQVKNAVTILERRYLKGNQQGKVMESLADMF